MAHRLAIIGIQVKPIWAGAAHCLKDTWNLKKGLKKRKAITREKEPKSMKSTCNKSSRWFDMPAS